MSPDDFFLDDLADAITADFTARQNPAVVLVGEWSTFKLDTRPRIILGLGPFRGVDLGGAGGAQHYIGGAVVDVGTNLQARALWGSEQTVLVHVAAPPPVNVPPDQVPKAARGVTWALAKRALAAMWRWHKGAFPWGAGRWLNEDQAVRTYGAALVLEARITIPVEDDPLDVATASQVDAYDELDIDAGTINSPTYNLP